MSNENRLLASVHAVTNMLSSSVNPDSALRSMLEAAIQAVDASGGSILLHDPNAHQLWFNLVRVFIVLRDASHIGARACFNAQRGPHSVGSTQFSAWKPQTSLTIHPFRFGTSSTTEGQANKPCEATQERVKQVVTSYLDTLPTARLAGRAGIRYAENWREVQAKL